MQKVPKKPVQRKPRGGEGEKAEDATEAKETEGTGSSALAHNAAKKDAGEVWTGGADLLWSMSSAADQSKEPGRFESFG